MLARRRVRLPPLMADTLLTPPFVRGHDHAVGDAGPALVLFGDYEDPDSAAAHRGVLALRERWDGFTYAWRHLPLSTAANGAALFAEGAAAQDAFWAYHHILLARQDSLSVPDLMSYAGQIGLDLAMLIEGIEQERDVQRILDDIARRQALRDAARRPRCSSRACAGRAAGSRTRWRARCVQPWPGEVLEERAGEIAVALRGAAEPPRGVAAPARGDDHGALARAGPPARVGGLHRAARAPRGDAAVRAASGSSRWRCWPSARWCTSTCAPRTRPRCRCCAPTRRG